MTIYRAMCITQMDSLNPLDVSVNTFHIRSRSVDLSQNDFNSFQSAVDKLYKALGYYMSTLVALTGHVIKLYNLSDAEPRVPIFQGSYSLTTTDTTALPTEVSMCISYQGVYLSGTPNARRRGRFFVGPLGNAATNSGTGRPSAGCLNGLEAAAQDFLDDSVAASNWEWIVYSRVSGGAAPVVSGWIDDSFDTQRRRGLAPSSRRLFSIP